MVRRAKLLSWAGLWCAWAVLQVSGQTFSVPDAEVTQPPTATRLEALLTAAQRDGWAPQARPLRAAALRAYERGDLGAADAWFAVYEWASLWGEPEAHFVPRWIAAVNAAQVGHANMPQSYAPRPATLGAGLSPDLQRWILQDRAFTSEFFSVISPVDYLPEVFATLDALYRAGPRQFQAYASLALALAVVFDVPPPPTWPHAQVRADALPRRFPAATAAFAWWVKQDTEGRLYVGLKRRSADELKFVVDAIAPFSELEWAQRDFPWPDRNPARAYLAVKYRVERIGRQPFWPGQTYRLADILATGGICPDQAYFAAEVGKSRGFPTVLFHGSGNDGRHAWIGYLDADRQWQLDVGRYAEQRFVTGVARDPQTWGVLTDHDLQFLREHFRSLPSYRQSRIHEAFAADFLGHGDADRAAAAARQALRFEPRNQDAWETLLAAERQRRAEPRAIEVILREAVLAFRRYPDLEAFYVSRVAESLRARGQTSEADAEVRRIAQKYRDDRTDISVRQARDIVLRSIENDPLEVQVRTYNAVVDNYGAGAGIAFCDDVVRIFVEHLIQLRNRTEATRAVERARRTLHFETRSQLDLELAVLESAVNALPRT